MFDIAFAQGAPGGVGPGPMMTIFIRRRSTSARALAVNAALFGGQQRSQFEHKLFGQLF